jgi:hypothetical protein
MNSFLRWSVSCVCLFYFHSGNNWLKLRDSTFDRSAKKLTLRANFNLHSQVPNFIEIHLVVWQIKRTERKIRNLHYMLILWMLCHGDRLCGLVTRVPGCRPRGSGFDSRRYNIFWIALGVEQGPLSLVRITEELLERKSSCSSLENWD